MRLNRNQAGDKTEPHIHTHSPSTIISLCLLDCKLANWELKLTVIPIIAGLNGSCERGLSAVVASC